MPCLKANFEADWIAYLREHMVNIQGWSVDEIAALDDRDVRIRHFEACQRRVIPRPRMIETAGDFVCPLDHRAGWNALQDKVRRGEDINPHLSTRHASILFLDGLLAEWGVQHFHLGIDQHPHNPAYIARTGPLLYALVTDDFFYAINVYSHQSFEDNGILDSIHRNWPELISRYRAKGVTGGDWTACDRKYLRSNNANVLTTVNDGTVYMPISGGVMASGMNAEAVKAADYWNMRVQGLQRDFETKLDELLPTLRQNGYDGESDIDAQLKFSDDGLKVLFPKYSVLATLNIVEE